MSKSAEVDSSHEPQTRDCAQLGERQVASQDGVNYAWARACYGREVADAIFHELQAEDCDRAYITRRELDRLVEWKGSGDRRMNRIVMNIVEGTLEDEAA